MAITLPGTGEVIATETVAGEKVQVMRSIGGTVIKTVTCTPTTTILAADEVIVNAEQVDAALRITNGTGRLMGVTVVDQADQKAQLKIFVHKANVTMGTENATPSITDADATSILGVVQFETADYYDLGGVSVAYAACSIGLVAVTGTDDIYVSIVNGSGTPTYTASSIILNLDIVQD